MISKLAEENIELFQANTFIMTPRTVNNTDAILFHNCFCLY